MHWFTFLMKGVGLNCLVECPCLFCLLEMAFLSWETGLMWCLLECSANLSVV